MTCESLQATERQIARMEFGIGQLKNYQIDADLLISTHQRPKFYAERQ